MRNEIEQIILKKIDKIRENKIIFYLNGFISLKFSVNSLSYDIKYDILTIKDSIEDTFFSINLNQVYKCEILENGLEMYLDNDITVKLIKE